jgi:hypothetical protein
MKACKHTADVRMVVDADHQAHGQAPARLHPSQAGGLPTRPCRLPRRPGVDGSRLILTVAPPVLGKIFRNQRGPVHETYRHSRIQRRTHASVFANQIDHARNPKFALHRFLTNDPGGGPQREHSTCKLKPLCSYSARSFPTR